MAQFKVMAVSDSLTIVNEGDIVDTSDVKGFPSGKSGYIVLIGGVLTLFYTEDTYIHDTECGSVCCHMKLADLNNIVIM